MDNGQPLGRNQTALKVLVRATYSEDMLDLVFKRVLVALIALSLIGGAMIQFAPPAFALASSVSMAGADADPCDHMGMHQQSEQPNQSMPCKSAPCDGALWDCMQMCLASSGVTALANTSGTVVAPVSHRSSRYWPTDVVHKGLSIEPDPFPPKNLVSA